MSLAKRKPCDCVLRIGFEVAQPFPKHNPNPLHACADPENFVRGGPILTLFFVVAFLWGWGEDRNAT